MQAVMSLSDTERNQPSAFKARMMQILCRFCTTVLATRHGKRMIFITSLYVELSHLPSLKRVAITKLNQLMQLASDDAALHLPATLGRFVWMDTPLRDTISTAKIKFPIDDESAMAFAEHVLAGSPKWIHYGRRQDMISDIRKLLGYCVAQSEAA